MDSREIVKRCIEFRDPPRVAWHFRTNPIGGRVWDESDFVSVGPATDPRHVPAPEQREWVTEWGVRRRRHNNEIGEAIEFPLGEGWERFDDYRFPDFEAEWRWTHLRAAVAAGHAAGKYVIGAIHPILQQAIDLRGMQNWFLDHAEKPAGLSAFLDRLAAVNAGIIRRYADAGVDGVITWDDMGMNDRAMLAVATFRELYFPRYKATLDLLHERGMHLMHHCCGQVREYMDLFVEAGLDVLQLDQPNLMGIEWLGRHYGGKLCFWNPVDIMTTIAAGDLDAIEDEARRQLWHLGNFGGGFMVKAYQQPEDVGMTEAQAQRQYEAFRRWGTYPLSAPTPNRRHAKGRISE